jgi:hypothetical protein
MITVMYLKELRCYVAYADPPSELSEFNLTAISEKFCEELRHPEATFGYASGMLLVYGMPYDGEDDTALYDLAQVLFLELRLPVIHLLDPGNNSVKQYEGNGTWWWCKSPTGEQLPRPAGLPTPDPLLAQAAAGA